MAIRGVGGACFTPPARCTTPHVSEEQVTEAFLDAVHHLLVSRDQVDELVDKAVRAELDTTDLHTKADQLFARVGAAAEAIDQLISRNARVSQDQSKYQRRFDKLTSEHAALLDEYHQLLAQISDLENGKPPTATTRNNSPSSTRPASSSPHTYGTPSSATPR